MRAPSIALCIVLSLIACGDPAAPDCSIHITETDIDGDTMTADGTFVTAQPLLVLNGPETAVIAGQDDGHGHATFDLSGLMPGRYDYHFDASCFDADGEPTIDAPTGSFTR